MNTTFALPSQPQVTVQRFGETELEVAALSPEDLSSSVASLRAAWTQMASVRGLDPRRVVAVLVQATEKWRDGGSPLRHEADRLVSAVTGYSLPMVTKGLDLLFSQLDEWRLKWYASRLGRVGCRASLAAQVLAGNIPGLAIIAIVDALFAGSATFLKLSVGEPVLGPLFLDSLREVDPEIGSLVAAAYWPGGSEDLERELFEGVDVAIASGSDEALQSLRSRVPVTTRFVAHPHKFAVGVVTTDAVNEDSAAGAAFDVAMWDQQGCLSPHTIYVEGSSAGEFANLLAAELARLAEELPRRKLPPSESSAVHQARGAAELRGARVLASSGGTDWTVVVDEAPGFTPSCLNRFVYVKPFDSLEALEQSLSGFSHRFSAIGLAVGLSAFPHRWGEFSALRDRLRVPRLCWIGELQDPPLWWATDGQIRLFDFLIREDYESLTLTSEPASP